MISPNSQLGMDRLNNNSKQPYREIPRNNPVTNGLSSPNSQLGMDRLNNHSKKPYPNQWVEPTSNHFVAPGYMLTITKLGDLLISSTLRAMDNRPSPKAHPQHNDYFMNTTFNFK